MSPHKYTNRSSQICKSHGKPSLISRRYFVIPELLSNLMMAHPGLILVITG